MGNRYRVLGDVAVVDGDGASRHVSGRQGEILAVLLAAHPDTVTAGRLIDEIWGESPPKDPEGSLHSAISRLRNKLGSDVITTPVGYAIDPGSVDSFEFDRALTTARETNRLEDFDAAMRLWTGDPYHGYEDHPTVLLEIERLKQSHRRASQEWHQLLIEEGRADEAVETLKLTVTGDPFDEAALSLYMRALTASGRKQEALAAFRNYQHRLAEETGLEPSLAIRELEVAILVDELSFPEPKSRPPVKMNLSVSYVERAPGERVAVGRVGRGPELFVHPGWLSALDQISAGLDMRSPLWASLSRSHQLIIFDRYGTGLSKGEPKDVSFQSSVDELKAVLETTTEGPVPVWAASAAGPICIAAAVEEPALISHLILYGTYASGPATFSSAASASITSLVRSSWGVGSDVLAHMLFPGGSVEQRHAWARFQKKGATPEMAAQLITQLYEADVSDKLSQLSIPCLVIHYRGDKGVPIQGGEHLAREIRGAEFVPLEGISHYPVPGEEGRVAEIVNQFLGVTSI